MARKALCVLMSVVLVVGLMPGLTAWGESNQVTTAAADETLDVNDDDTGSESSENNQTQDNPAVDNEQDERDENDDELSDDPDNEPGEGDAVLDEGDTAKVELMDTLLTDSIADETADPAQGLLATAGAEMVAQSENRAVYMTSVNANTTTVNGENCAGAQAGEKVDVYLKNNGRGSTFEWWFDQRINGGVSSTERTTLWSGTVTKGDGQYHLIYTYTVPAGYEVYNVYASNKRLALDIRVPVPVSVKYAVALDVNGGTKKAGMWTSRNVTVGNSVTLPTASQSPGRSNYTFSGWNTARDGSGDHYDSAAKFTPTSDATLYAEWTRTVTLSADGSDASFTPASPLTFYYDSTGAGTPSSSTVVLTGKNGWTAYGWTTATATTNITKSAAASFTQQASALAKTNTTYYALLQRDLTLTYDANGADAATSTVPESQSVTQLINTRNYTGSYTKKTVNLAEPGDSLKKKYYNFVGWTINGVLYDMKSDTKFTWKNANADAQVTAYATWERIPPVENNVTVEMTGWTYGATPNSPTYTADDGIERISVEYSASKTGTYSPTKPTNAGTYWVRATVPAHDNYLEGTASASFTIAPKEVGIEWNDGEFTYDGTPHKPTATVKAADLVEGDTDCTVTVSGEQTDAGSYTAWASGLSNPNYALPASGTSHAFTINKVALKVKAKDNAITYGDAPQANGVEYFDKDGKKLSSEPAGLTGSLSYAYDYRQYDDISTESKKYTIEPSGLGSGNYDITYEPGKLTVNQREVTLLWSTPDTFIYNGEEQRWPAPTVGNTVNGDKLTAEWADGADKNVHEATNLGAYTPTVKGLSGDKAGNYKLPDNATGSWSITMTPAPTTNNMTVSIAGWTYGRYQKEKNVPTVSADYGAETATFAYYTDEKCKNPVADANMETITLDDGSKCKVPKNAGTYWVNAIITGTDTYPGGSATCEFTIKKAQATIKGRRLVLRSGISGAWSAYYGVELSGEVLSSDESLFYKAYEGDPSTLKSDAGLGTHPINVKTVDADTAAALSKNYDITTSAGSYTLVDGPALGNVLGGTKTYNGKLQAVGIALLGSSINSYTAENDSSTVREGIADFAAGRVTSTQLADNAQNAGWRYGNTVYFKNAGTHIGYIALMGTDSTGKRSAAYETATIIINPAPLVVNVGDKTIEYGDDPATKPFDDSDKEVTYAGFVADETESGLRATGDLTGSVTAYSYAGDTASRVPGRYPISVATTNLSATNYSITYAPGTLIVKPKTLRITWPDSTLTYNGSQQKYGPVLDGLPDGAKVSLKLSGTTEATDVGTYMATVVGLEGADAANFTLDVSDSSVLSHTWSIVPAELTVKAVDSEIIYGDAPAGKGVTCTDAKGNTVNVESLSGTLQYSFKDGDGPAYEQYGDVGTYPIMPSGLASPNYNIKYEKGTLTVNPREVSLTWPEPDALRWTGEELTYGTPALGNVVNNDDVSLVAAAYSGNKGRDGGAYMAKVDTDVALSGEKAGNYTLQEDGLTHDWSIYGAPNNVKVAIDDWTYGNDPDPVTPTVEADNSVGLTVGYSKSPYGPFESAMPKNPTTGRVDAGTYYVRAAVPKSDVHDAAEAVTEFHVLPREATLTWLNTSFIYNGSSHVPTAAVSGLPGDSCSVLGVSGEAVDAGVHTATATGLDNSNYKLPINDSVQFTIATRVLTVTANPAAITYGDAPTDAGVTYSGFAEGDSEARLGGTLTYGFDYRQFDNVGTYEITPGGLSSPNYAITYVPGALTVKPREVTLTWDAPSTFTYDGAEHTWNPPTVGNTVNGDKLTATWKAGAKDSATDQGTYEPEVGGLVAGTGTDADNYKLPDPAKGTWKIVPSGTNAMTVSIAGWTYGKYTAACGPIVTAAFGAANPTNITYAYYTDANCTKQVAAADMDATNNVPKNVGSYWVKATIPAGPNNNYPAAEATCAFTISKADITVTADDKQSVRQDSGTIAGLTCTVSGDVASWDSLAGYFQATSDDSPNQIKPNAAGSYTIKATWATGKSAADLPNYNVKFEPGTYTVTRLLAKVVASGSSWVYDGTDTDGAGKRKAITVKVNDSISGTALDGTAGAAAVTTYYSENEFGSGISDLAKRLQAAAEVDADFKTSFASLKSALSGYAQTSPTYKDAGTHRVHFIIVSDQATPDVIVGYKDVVITPAPLVVTANDKGIAYGDPAANDGVKYAGLVAADLDGTEPKSGVLDVAGLAYGYGTYVAGSAPGKYPITPSGLVATPANYSITYQPGTLTVGAKELELKWPDENEFPYNGRERAYRPKLIDPSTGNEVAGAKVQVQMTAGTYAKTDAGSYTATVSGLAGDDKGNYVLKSGTNTKYTHPWSITPVALTVTANDNSIVYGDAPAAKGVTYTGLRTPEAQAGFTGSLSYSYDYAQFGPAREGYTITPSGIASPNYTITFVPGKLTVHKKKLELVWSEDSALEFTGSDLTYDKPLLEGVEDGDNVRVGVYQDATKKDVGLYTASVVSLTGRDKDNYLLPLDATHQWQILGVENGLELSMDGWTYGDEPGAPSLTADHDGDKATFAYYLDEACEKPVPAADLADGVPAVAGSYWVKATVPKSDAGNYREAEAVAGFKVLPRPITIKAADQIVKVGDAVATDAGQVTADDLASGDKLSGVTISASSPTTSPSFGGSVMPSAVTIENADRRDVTSSYDITYERGDLNVVGDYSTENGKVIYVVLADIWVTVAEAAELLADPDLDEVLMVRTGVNAYETGTGEPLEVHVLDRGGLAAAVGVYTVTFQTNPEVQARVHVMDSSSTNEDSGVTVYANDTEPSADLLRRAKAGDADAVAELVALAGAVAVDEDGNTIPVTGVDLSAVDPDRPGTYRAVYSTDDGDSAAANVVLKEGADDPDPKDGLREKIEEAEGIVGPLDPANPTDEEKKLLEEIEEAKLILDDPDATPEQIRDAIKRLDDAIAALKAAREGAGNDNGGSAGNGSATKPDSVRKAAPAKTGDALPVALLTTTALAAACALAFAHRRRES